MRFAVIAAFVACVSVDAIRLNLKQQMSLRAMVGSRAHARRDDPSPDDFKDLEGRLLDATAVAPNYGVDFKNFVDIVHQWGADHKIEDMPSENDLKGFFDMVDAKVNKDGYLDAAEITQVFQDMINGGGDHGGDDHGPDNGGADRVLDLFRQVEDDLGEIQNIIGINNNDQGPDHNDDGGECHCWSSTGKSSEDLCEKGPARNDIYMCTMDQGSVCHWGPGENPTCQQQVIDFMNSMNNNGSNSTNSTNY